MGEEPRLTLNDGVEPGPGPRWLVPEALELVHGPPSQMLVDAPCEEAQLGTVEASVEGRRLARWRCSAVGPEACVPAVSREAVPPR